ncbi:Bax inhibitor-1/YccA family protein [Sedimenticola sp.]|uniref:Bax inhibitor-1/YccA family protein n=1 Tax=Sedimenticola sp. TaxID=1940285 RepID=UPI003D0E4930
MNRFNQTIAQPAQSALAVNKVIKNTYMLLSATLLFSGVMAMVSMFLVMPPMAYMLSVIGAMILGMFVLPRTANSSAGLGVIFLITGLLGFGLGAILTLYLKLPHGPQIIATALGGTGVIFLGLSGYALTSKRDFSFMGGFVFAGMLVMMVAIIANIFLHLPFLSLAISAGVMLLMSAYILFQTSQMMNGGETNYIYATYSLYMAIFNIFISLLQILGVFGGDD